MQKNKSNFWAAALLMATSAIGPGFLTQTTVFTNQLLFNFGFVIVLSILMDLVAQISIWQVLTVSNKRAHELADEVFKGAGVILSLVVFIGGLVFNIGNLAGAGLGLNAIFGIEVSLGGLISGLIVAIIFISNQNLRIIDFLVKILAIVMVLCIVYMAFNVKLPIDKLALGTFMPDQIDYKSTITLVGGTVGGYISFAGAHRLLESNIYGVENLKKVTKSAYSGILVTGVFRYMFFISILGVILSGAVLNENNPTSSVFETVFGKHGKIMFGIIIWVASFSSVLGATFTSVSFVKNFQMFKFKNPNVLPLLFVICSAIILYAFGKPVWLLVFAGYINGFILPFALSLVLVASRRPAIVGDFKLASIYYYLGWFLVAGLLIFAVLSLIN